jgi:succinate-semialdehyde dehydrogenase/glutarate-semialdehyde dehydrogenase
MPSVTVRNPYTGAQDFSFEEPEAATVADRIERLRQQQPEWAALDLTKRLAALVAFAASVKTHQQSILAALVADTGRTHVSAMEIDALDAFINQALTTAPEALAAPAARTAEIPIIEATTNRIPLGVIGNISPWNFPVILSFLDTIPALAAGNAVVIKPSEVTPRWIEPMLEAINDCPEIASVLDILPGTGITGAEIISHVDGVVFTGSVATGRKVAAAAAQQFIPACLELGGKDPAVVLAGADIELAARTLTFAATQSTGQACQSIERVYVPRENHAEFVEHAVSMANSMELNHPNINIGIVGPFIFEQQGAKVLRQLADARGAGAEILCGGELLNHGGFWMRPTVVTNVTHDMALMQEETFGPVLPVMAYDTEAEALELANDSQYGLSAAVFAATPAAGREFAAQLKVGAVSINDAALTALVHEFEHDAFGLSGLGASRAGLSAYRRFTREQAVLTNTTGQPLLLNTLS